MVYSCVQSCVQNPYHFVVAEFCANKKVLIMIKQDTSVRISFKIPANCVNLRWCWEPFCASKNLRTLENIGEGFSSHCLGVLIPEFFYFAGEKILPEELKIHKAPEVLISHLLHCLLMFTLLGSARLFTSIRSKKKIIDQFTHNSLACFSNDNHR